MVIDSNSSARLVRSNSSLSKGFSITVDVTIILSLFIHFASFPFIFRNLATSVYSLVLHVSLLAVGVALFIFKSRLVIRTNIISDVKLKVALLCYFAYFWILMFVSLSHSSDASVGKAAIIEIRELIFVSMVMFFLSEKGLQYIMRLYVTLLSWFSMLGLLLVIMVFLGQIHPLAEISLDNLVGGGGEDIRLFYGIGFVWPDTWIGSLIGWERLQSFADEAGTFAFALVPAILFAAYWRMRWRMVVMSVALIFTFSVGAIFWCVAIAVIYWLSVVSWKEVRKPRNLIIFLLIFLSLMALGFSYSELWELVGNYFSGKYSSNDDRDTSVGMRLEAILAAFEVLNNHPWGLGVGSSGVALGGARLASGWFVPLVEAGYLGWLFYLTAFIFFLWRASSDAFSSMGVKQIVAIIVLGNAYEASQRGGIDANVWQLFWLVLYLRVADMHNNNLVNWASITNRKSETMPARITDW